MPDVSPLQRIILAQIEQQKSISIAHYMALALSHPTYGYYTARNPFGAHGDFITAPDVSQMFGEIIGLRLAQHWMDCGQPHAFNLVECGAGRGTLMADMLRVMSKVPGLMLALHVHLIEISPVLMAAQKQALGSFAACAQWHSTLNTVPEGAFALVANEFLDALPVEQFVYIDGAWHERRIGAHNGQLVFVAGARIPHDVPGEEGQIIERSQAQDAYIADTAQRVQAHNGLAMFIDYGALHSGTGDTLQAMRQHSFADVLQNPGLHDLTTHIDFARLAALAQHHGCKAELATQSQFLKSNGIEERAAVLAAKNPQHDVAADLHRLTSDKEMGKLFKVMTLSKAG